MNRENKIHTTTTVSLCMHVCVCFVCVANHAEVPRSGLAALDGTRSAPACLSRFGGRGVGGIVSEGCWTSPSLFLLHSLLCSHQAPSHPEEGGSSLPLPQFPTHKDKTVQKLARASWPGKQPSWGCGGGWSSGVGGGCSFPR